MGWIVDLIKSVPLTFVLRERIAQAEKEYAVFKAQSQEKQQSLEKENAALKALNLELKSENESLELDLAKANGKVAALEKVIHDLSLPKDLDELSIKLLTALSQRQHLNSTQAAEFVGCTIPEAELRFQRMMRDSLVRSDSFGPRGNDYHILLKGREKIPG